MSIDRTASSAKQTAVAHEFDPEFDLPSDDDCASDVELALKLDRDFSKASGEALQLVDPDHHDIDDYFWPEETKS